MNTRRARSCSGSRHHALAAAVVALLVGGCAAPDAWKVMPNYRVSHAGPGAGQGYLALARQYEGERRWHEALDAWRKAAVEAPDDVEILNALGMAAAGQGDYRGAIAALRRATELAPGRAALFNNLGYALLLDGRGEEARSALRQALVLEPNHRLARVNLSRLEPVALAVKQPEPAPAPEPTPAPQEASATAVESGTAELRVLPNVAALQVSGAVPIEKPVPPIDVVAAQEAPAPAAETMESPPAEPSLQTQPNVAPLQMSSAEPAGTSSTGAPATQAAGSAPAEAAEAPAPLPVAGTEAVVAPAPIGEGLRVEISNGNGVTGMAARLRRWLRERGLESQARLTNLRPYSSSTTVVYYRSGFDTEAREIARRMPLSVEIAPEPGRASRADVRVVLGHDMRHTAACAETACGGSGALAVAASGAAARR